MPQSGYTPIQIYASSTGGNTPSAGNLTNDTKGAELAINIADGKLFYKDSSNVVQVLANASWSGTVTSVGATSPIASSGGTTPTISISQATTSTNGYLSSTDWNTFNNKQPAGTYVTSVTGTAPVVSSGGTTPAISMAVATSSANGYLSSTDWSTFNGKQAALVSGTNIKTVSGTTLLGSGDLGTIGTGYGGTGLTSFTANGIVYASSTSALATSSTNTWDGTTQTLTVNGSGFKARTGSDSSNYYAGFLANYSYGEVLRFYVKGGSTAESTILSWGEGAGLTINNGGASAPVVFKTVDVERMRLPAAGGVQAVTCVSVGNATPAASGAGITFPATQSASSDANTLDDYEEGTWTPALTVASGSLTAANQGSLYVKTGQFVCAYGYINVSAVSTPSGALTITGLPFTTQSQYGAVALSFFSGGLTTAVDGYCGGSGTTITVTNFNANTIGAGANIMFTAMYRASA